MQDIYSPLLCNIWVEEILRKETFPKDLKSEDVPPVFKKDNPHLVKNCIPVSVLSIVSKKLERKLTIKINIFLPRYVDTEKALVHKRLCSISLKNGSLWLIKYNT